MNRAAVGGAEASPAEHDPRARKGLLERTALFVIDAHRRAGLATPRMARPAPLARCAMNHGEGREGRVIPRPPAADRPVVPRPLAREVERSRVLGVLEESRRTAS